MKEIKAISLDLDGTALLDDHDHFTEHLHEVLNRVYEKGVMVVIITGRPHSYLPVDVLKPAAWHDILVTSNGAEFGYLDSGEIFERKVIPYETVKRMYEDVEGSGFMFEASDEHSFYLTNKTFARLQEAGGHPFHMNRVLPTIGKVVGSFEEFPHDNIVKLNLFGKTDAEDRYLEEIAAKNGLLANHTGLHFFEVGCQGVSKAEGLRRFCEIKDISTENVLTFGDSGNDRSILSASGISVAMGNAPQDIKDLATYVTDTNMNDGVAKMIEKLLLN